MFEKRASLAPVIRFLHGCIAYEATVAVFAAVVVFSAGSRTAVFPFLFACGGVLCLSRMRYTMQAAARRLFQMRKMAPIFRPRSRLQPMMVAARKAMAQTPRAAAM